MRPKLIATRHEQGRSKKGLAKSNYPKPCPFCGQRLAELEVVLKEAVISKNCTVDYVVACPCCDARGPWGTTKKIATDQWNRRDKPIVIEGRGNINGINGHTKTG